MHKFGPPEKLPLKRSSYAWVILISLMVQVVRFHGKGLTQYVWKWSRKMYFYFGSSVWMNGRIGFSENCHFPGLTDYSNSSCPPGFWCSGSGPPIFCPAGTKRPLPGAASPSQCEPCTGGTFCPDPTATERPNVEGIPCRASYQCPAGRILSQLMVVL